MLGRAESSRSASFANQIARCESSIAEIFFRIMILYDTMIVVSKRGWLSGRGRGYLKWRRCPMIWPEKVYVALIGDHNRAITEGRAWCFGADSSVMIMKLSKRNGISWFVRVWRVASHGDEQRYYKRVVVAPTAYGTTMEVIFGTLMK
jgi:hypothetical protein